ncbi:LUD domain-containing protein [Chloroflexota bacterium]
MSVFSEYKKKLMSAVHNPRMRLALSRGTDSYRENVKEALGKFPHSIPLAQEVRETKTKAIPKMEELVRQASEVIESNHGKAYLARTADDALEIIAGLVGKGKVVVKSKSFTTEEIHLREHLEELGNEVYETDMGEFIIQKLGSRPMHTTPALHVPREDVAELISKVTGKKLPPDDIGMMVAAVRELLRDKFVQADVGISGANVVAADTGTLFIIENEGNARLCTGFPPVHIALVGMEKLVPTFGDACKVAEVTWRYANYTVPSYVNLISGPSKTGDIEKVTTYGAHGPREMHVIFLDAGRTRLAEDPVLSQALSCLRCGACLFECPVFSVTAGNFGDKYFASLGAVWAGIVDRDMESASAMAYTCLTCGRCKVRCPIEIDGASMVVKLRQMLAEGDLSNQ